MQSIIEQSKVSSMRVSLYWIVAFSGILTISVSAAIILQAIKGGSLDWLGVSATVTSISVFTGQAFFAKAHQKKYEK
mgnify:CR=1 FL=1